MTINIFDEPESRPFVKFGQLSFTLTPARNSKGGIYLRFKIVGDPLDGSRQDERNETSYSQGLHKLTLNPIRSLAELRDFVKADFAIDAENNIGVALDGPKYWAKWQISEWHEKIREDDAYWFGDDERMAKVQWSTDTNGNKTPYIVKTSIEILDLYPNQVEAMAAYENENGKAPGANLDPVAIANDIPF